MKDPHQRALGRCNAGSNLWSLPEGHVEQQASNVNHRDRQAHRGV